MDARRIGRMARSLPFPSPWRQVLVGLSVGDRSFSAGTSAPGTPGAGGYRPHVRRISHGWRTL